MGSLVAEKALMEICVCKGGGKKGAQSRQGQELPIALLLLLENSYEW